MEKLNLVKILKDCPKGTKLYSPALGECALEGVNDNNDYPIKVTYKIINNDTRFDYFTKYGYLLINKPDAECMLFPSKEQRDWNKWQRPFVDGDVVTCENQIAIFKKYISDYSGLAECYVFLDNNLEIDIDGHYYVTDLATEKEKAKLFKALEDNGYKWNPETKTLKNWTIQDAKDGDVIFYDDGWTCIFKCIHGIWYSSYCFITSDGEFHTGYEEHAVDSKINGNAHIATKEQRDFLFQKIKEAGYRWDTETKILEKLITPKFKDEDKNHLWTIQDAKDGDVLAINWYEGYDYWEKIVIFKKYHNEGATSPCVEGYGNTFKNRKLAFHEEVPRFSETWTSCLEPATKEQRDLLFQTIKEAGYRWNTETKILEKLIVPKFKVGDSIQSKTDNNDKFTITNIDNDKFYYGCRKRYEFMIPVAKQDNWELVPNKFDITTLKPFDKVLVRDDNTSMWINAFYGFYDAVTTEKYEFVASAVHWAQCIPYEGNEHLLGTDDDCDEYYKNWV